MIRRSLEWFGGSVLVYVLAAACGSSGGGGSRHEASAAGESNEGGAQGAGGVNGTAGDGETDAGIMNPVPDAMAAAGAGNDGSDSCDCPDPYVPPEPTVVEADCDIVGGSGAMFAEAAFPGKTAEELTRAVATIEFDYEIATKFAASAPVGYSIQLSNVFVRDGYIATNCGSSGQDHVASKVTFTLP